MCQGEAPIRRPCPQVHGRCRFLVRVGLTPRLKVPRFDATTPASSTPASMTDRMALLRFAPELLRQCRSILSEVFPGCRTSDGYATIMLTTSLGRTGSVTFIDAAAWRARLLPRGRSCCRCASRCCVLGSLDRPARWWGAGLIAFAEAANSGTDPRRVGPPDYLVERVAALLRTGRSDIGAGARRHWLDGHLLRVSQSGVATTLSDRGGSTAGRRFLGHQQLGLASAGSSFVASGTGRTQFRDWETTVAVVRGRSLWNRLIKQSCHVRRWLVR